MNTGGYIGSILDGLCYSISGGYIIYLSKRKNNILKAVLIILGLINLVYGVFYIYNKTLLWNSTRIPTKNDIIETFQNSKTEAKSDTLIESEFGFEILIPKGFSYAIINEKLPLMMLKEKSGVWNSTISIEKIDEKPIGNIIDTLKENLSGANSTYQFLSEKIDGIPSDKSLIFTVTKNGNLLKGILYVNSIESPRFIVMLSFQYNTFDTNIDIAKKIVNSFRTK